MSLLILRFRLGSQRGKCMKSRVKEREQLCSLGGFAEGQRPHPRAYKTVSWVGFPAAMGTGPCGLLHVVSRWTYVGTHFPPLGLPTPLLAVLFYLLSVPLVSICPLGKDLLSLSPKQGYQMPLFGSGWGL